MLLLDHVAVIGETLQEATAHAEAALGTVLQPGGKHPQFGTHNCVLGLGDGIYLEAIAIDPAAPPPERPRWFGLDRFEGPPRLSKWVCAVPDMQAALAHFPEAGVPVALSRGEMRWTMAVPEDGMLPFDGLFPALIEWQDTVPPGKSLPAQGVKLTTLEVIHPRAQELAERLKPFLDEARVVFVSEESPALRAYLQSAAERWVLS